MIEMSLSEAQLFKMLCGFFGRDQVIVRMSVLTVCGGELPEDIDWGDDSAATSGMDVRKWARSAACLFTIVDSQDEPKLVIEFFSGYDQGIDAEEAEHQRFMRPILWARKIPYITISNDEFSDALTPGSGVDFFGLLRAKVAETELVAV